MNSTPIMSKRTKPGSSSKSGPGTPKRAGFVPRSTAASRARAAKLKTPTRPPRATKPADTETTVASSSSLLPPSASVKPPRAPVATPKQAKQPKSPSRASAAPVKKKASAKRTMGGGGTAKTTAASSSSTASATAATKKVNKTGPATPGLTRRVASINSTRRNPPSTTEASASSQDPEAESGGAGHADATVTARKNALSAMGGVKIDVFIRIRPESTAEMKSGDAKVVVVPGDDKGQLKLVTGDIRQDDDYKFDHVLGQGSGQQEVFNQIVEPIVDQVATGMSCCLYAYGQTGAGKTYTMRGELGDDELQHGVIQRSVTALLKRLDENPDYIGVTTHVSFLEVYNETLEDLLVKTVRAPVRQASSAKQRLTIVDDPERGSICHGLTEVQVENIDQVMALLREADQVARVSATKMNKNSNRAHRIFTVVVKYTRFDVVVPATMTFVDLAGSEDINKSEAKGATAKEAGHINKSLLSLGRVITALSSNKKHIPYRDSKLTQLMSESLGGLCKTSFIACISPSSTSLTETTKTLRYAERAMQALNISQMPQWKQDQIMIDGLTRKVGQQSVQLERQSEAHRKENLAVRKENVYLKACVEGILGSLGKLNTNIADTLTAGSDRAAVRADATMQTLLGSMRAMGDAQEAARVEHHAAGQAIAATVASSGVTFVGNMAETAAAHQDAYTTAKVQVGTFSGQIGGCDEALTIGTETIATLSRVKHEQTVAGCNESESFVRWSGQQFASFTGMASTLKSDADILHAALDVHACKIQERAVSIGVNHSASGRARDEGVETLNGALASAEKDAAVFVDEQFRRDSQEPPNAKAYVFPQSFARTDEYSNVLADTPVACQREAQITAGGAEPGSGVDFPGNLGTADPSGILADESAEAYAAVHKDVEVDAARDSDAEEYEGEADELLESSSLLEEASRSESESDAASPAGKLKKKSKSVDRGLSGGSSTGRSSGGKKSGTTTTTATTAKSRRAVPGAVSLAASNPARNFPRIDRSSLLGNKSTATESPRRPPRQSRP